MISGIPDLNQICVNFSREKSVGEGWSFGGMHNGAVTPSENYIVVITDHPRAHLGDGVCFKFHAKRDNGWDYEFSGKTVKFWKR